MMNVPGPGNRSMRNKTISVIVPVYNVEPYLKKCLDSLCAQTFDDVEFIVVDDGSTDRSAVMADSYAQDERFRIFHTENSGLSAARNFGIEQSEGEWLMFLDGDDYVAPDFCERPLKTALDHDADLVIFRCFSVRDGTVVAKKAKKKLPPVLDRETAVEYYGNIVWNKFYRRKLFDHIRYPEGRVYEDVATTYKLIYEAAKIVFIDEALYYHLYRSNSINHVRSSDHKRDAFLSADEKYNWLITAGYPGNKAETSLYSYALSYASRTRKYGDPAYLKAEETLDRIVPDQTRLTWKERIMSRVWKLDKKLFHFICGMLNQKYDE